MATFIHGIAASENIDTSGERISIAGMDISSLATEGTLTYEHEAATGPKGEKITIKMPEQTVGKVLKAKKIFSEEDCEDEHQLYFWNKCKTPYIYALGELFDDYTDAARDLAGKLRYDADRKNQNERTVVNFSIEGAYIAKEGIEVTRSVARKITLTSLPCNKAARAEIVPADRDKDDIDALFKTETIEIELFKSEPKIIVAPEFPSDMQKHADVLGIAPMQKNVLPFKKPLASAPGVATKPAPAATAGAPATPKLPGSTNNPGRHIGNTKSGKGIMSHARIHEYHGFSSQDHNDAAHLHHAAAQAATDPKTGAHHLDKMKLHLQAGKTAEMREGRFARGKAQNLAAHGLSKTMDAGSAMAAPSQLTGTAALAKEDLQKKPLSEAHPADMKVGGHYNIGLKSGEMAKYHRSTEAAHHFSTENGTKIHKVKRNKSLVKSEWLSRAEQEYQQWDKREEFESFMKVRLPHLAKGEIDAIGKTLALKKSLDIEKALSKLIKK